jgi:ABC-type ATPase involved in cell division
MVFQDSRLLPRLTALENVTYALRVVDLGLSMGEARHRARDALCDAGLEERLDAFPRQLSAGQRQRAAVARAIACAPAVVLADEPTASLDAASSAVVKGLLRRLTRTGTAVLLATCDADVGELGRPGSGRVLCLEDGTLTEEQSGVTRRWVAV